MKCVWCGETKRNIVGPGGLLYCSESCERAALLHSIESFEAMLEGDDPPSKQEIDARLRSAERWTTEKMQDRINQFKEGNV